MTFSEAGPWEAGCCDARHLCGEWAGAGEAGDVNSFQAEKSYGNPASRFLGFAPWLPCPAQGQDLISADVSVRVAE